MNWQQLRKRLERPIKFVGVGTLMTGINTLVLVLLVSGLGMFPVAANLARTCCTTQLSFYLHRKFTWKGEHRTTLWQQWYRYHLLKIGSTAVHQLSFLALTVLTSMPYLLAYLICVMGWGAANLCLASKLVFAFRSASDPRP